MGAPAVVFCLHALGGSARAFDPVTERLRDLAPDLQPVAIDLPGFGEQSPAVGTTVEAMADHVVGAIARHLAGQVDGSATRWLLLGHSMGGKVASVVAARTLAGRTPLFGLAGVVLLAGSPPVPEPMSEDRRAEMRAWAATGPLDDAAARTFVDANVGSPLPPDLDALAVADLRRTSPEAWTAWLDRGSREDWSGEVGTSPAPALIVAGGADGEDLGAYSQRRHNGAVYPRATVQVLAGAGHLLPLERPDEVADLIAGFWRDVAGLGPAVPAGFARVLASDHTSARTRAALAVRALADDAAYRPQVLDATQLATLRAVADRVLPVEEVRIDLAARLDAQLAEGRGDGWRHRDLPPDPDAYRAGLDALADLPALTDAEQDDRLRALDGWLGLWFADVRNDLVRLWLAHPAALARIGFDGFANGGDGDRFQGFQRFGAGEREAWEPAEIPASAEAVAR